MAVAHRRCVRQASQPRRGRLGFQRHYRIGLSRAAAFRDGLSGRTTSSIRFDPLDPYAFFEVAHELGGMRPGRVLD
jgi:hypothetical protein